MRSKAPLALLEQVVMLAVFALAAVLCLRAFLWADARSEQFARRDQALVLAQSAAETLKNCRGNLNTAAHRLGGGVVGGRWTVGYDENWNETAAETAVYWLYGQTEPAPVEGLGQALVFVCAAGEDAPLCSLTVAWQEVAQDG